MTERTNVQGLQGGLLGNACCKWGPTSQLDPKELRDERNEPTPEFSDFHMCAMCAPQTYAHTILQRKIKNLKSLEYFNLLWSLLLFHIK